MKRAALCAVFVCVAIATACGARNNASNSAGIAGSNSNKISFGIYDMSSSGGPYSIVTSAMRNDSAAGDPQTTVANAAATVEREMNSPETTTGSAIYTATTDRKIIRNAELSLETENPEAAQRQITAIAEQKGGFVVESQQSSSDIMAVTGDIVQMTIRIPSEKFSEVLIDVRRAASRVVVESVKGQDVTEEFIDIEAQVRSKKALEQQFMEIMKQADSVEEALSVQSQLATVRGEIERIEGRKRFIENQSSLSTIKIRLQTAKVFASSSAGFGTRLSESFSTGFDVALNFVLGLVTFVVATLPFAVFVGLPAFVIIRYVLRRQARPRSFVELAEDELKST